MLFFQSLDKTNRGENVPAAWACNYQYFHELPHHNAAVDNILKGQSVKNRKSKGKTINVKGQNSKFKINLNDKYSMKKPWF